MKLKLLVVLLLVAFCYSSCKNISDIEATLDDISEYMEERPDSALSVLQKMDPNQLSDKKQKAKHALLLSIALDKNYIDTTNFNIIQPAIDHYLKYGSPTEKLRTYYYMGRILQNNREDEKAMEKYVLGLNVSAKSSDYLTKGRLLFSKAQLHNNLYEFDKYASEMKEAARCFKISKKNSSYVNSLFHSFYGYNLINDSINARNILFELRSSINGNNLADLSKLYEAKLLYHTEQNQHDSIEYTLDSYFKVVNKNNIKWLTVANSFFVTGCYPEGLEALKMYDSNFGNQSSRYHAIASGLYDSLGNYREALNHYKKYVKLSDSADMAIFRANTKFVEEKYALQLQNEMERNSKRIVAICAVMAILLLVAVIRWLESAMKQNREKFQRQCELLEYEKENLLDILEKNRELDNRIGNAIEARLAIINQFFKAHVTENYDTDKKAIKEMEALFNDKGEFLKNTTLIVERKNPQFIAHLKQRGLTEQEIHFTCLYVIGLRGVHIGKYLQTTNIYNISSSIRRKLGIDEYKTNLDKLINDLYERFKE